MKQGKDMTKKAHFSDYMESGKKLVKALFPNHFKNINKVRTRPVDIDKEGILEITENSILVGTAGVGQRLSEDWIEYDKEHGRGSAMEAFMTIMFHYGFQSAMDHTVSEKIKSEKRDLALELLELYSNLDKETKTKLDDAGFMLFQRSLLR